MRQFSHLSIPLTLALFFAGQNVRAGELRYLNFSVKNQYEIYVRDLRAEEVELQLDGKPVKIRFFGSKEVNTVSAILLENSPRTAFYPTSLPQWRQVNPIDLIRLQMYSDFFPRLTESGPVLLAEFGREIKVLQEFTSYPDLLAGALRDLDPDYMKSGIHDPEVGRAIGRGVDWLRERSERRKNLIIFTAHIDRESYGNLEEYQDMLRQVDIDLYVISYAAARPSGLGSSFEERMNKYFFKRLVEETAGWVYIVGEYTYLDELFTDFKGRIYNNYTVGFLVEPEEVLKEHEIHLEIARDKCQLTHRRVMIY